MCLVKLIYQQLGGSSTQAGDSCSTNAISWIIL